MAAKWLVAFATSAGLCAPALAGQGASAIAGQQAATRQRALEAAWDAELEGQPKKYQTPIQRVVALLHKMKDELQAEADKEAEMYEKMVCWCESNEKEKTKAVAEAEAKDAALGSEVEERAARFGELQSLITTLKEEIADNKKTLNEATAIREREAEEFRGHEKEMVMAVTNLRNAITVLSKHQGSGALLQMEAPMLSGMKVLLRDVALKYELMKAGREERRPAAPGASLAQVGQGSAGVALLDLLGQGSEHAAEVLPLDIAEHLISRAAKSGPAASKAAGIGSGGFLQATQPIFESKSSARSGQIFGVLKQMQEEFEGELSTIQKEELKAQEDFKALAAAKTQQIETGAKKLDDLQAEDAENQKALSDAKEDLSLTRQQRSEDVKFLQNLKVQCNDLDHQWHQRSETRGNEITAVAEAIAIITEDDARDLMRKTVTLLQRSASEAVSATMAKRRAGAAEALRRAADSPDFEADDLLAAWHGRASPAAVGTGPKAQLATLAVNVQLDAFTKVKELLDKMVVQLKDQQAEEVQFKAHCTDNLETNEKTIYDKSELKKDLEARMEELENTLARLQEEIAAHKGDIESAQKQIKEAGQQREAENTEFQTTVADQRATQTILKKALGKLKDFYEKKIGHTVSLAQVSQEPPVKFNAYKTNAGSNSVIGLIEQIIEDSARLEKEATDSEYKAQVGYENFVQQSNGVIKSLQDAIAEKTDAVASSKNDHALAGADHESTVDELESLEQFKADLHNQCDFVLKNFDIRQRARLQEIEAIQQAKAILSGDQSAIMDSDE